MHLLREELKAIVQMYLNDFGIGASGSQIEGGASVLVDSIDTGPFVQQSEYSMSMTV